MSKFAMLSDKEFDHLMESYDKAMDNWMDGMSLSRAFQNVLRWCGRRGISKAEFWDWIND